MLIRKLETHAEYLAAEEVQRRVWRFPDRELIPLNELVVAQRIGGHVLGAFAGRRLVGFSFGIPALEGRKVYHYSRMTGVLPGLRDAGVGLKLKLFQRRCVLDQGLDLVRWTFDPLQSRNAFFNVEKLGATVGEYLVNLYGESGSRFNRGLPTDRVVPRWKIRAPRVSRRLAGRHSPPTVLEALSLPATVAVSGGRPRPARFPRGARLATLEIPADIDGVKKQDLGLAQAWRRATRAAFLAAFDRGYEARGFATDGSRSFYLLERGPDRED